MPTGPERRLAYLVSRYPTLSMIFVIREVVELRRLGFTIDVVSINDPDRARDALSPLEQQEQSLTHYIKSQGVLGALAAHVQGLLGRPVDWLRCLLRTVAWAGLDLKRFFYQLMYFTEALMVARWMRARGHHHLHVHLGNVAATVGLYVKLYSDCGLSMTIHGPDEFYDARGQLLREKAELADFVVCISHFARSQMMLVSDPVHWDKFVVCRLGVDIDAFPPRAGEPAGDGSAGDAPPRILCLGRLTPAKGQHILLQALRVLKDRGVAFTASIVGAGPDRDSLEAHARELKLGECATFVGPVNPDKVRGWYERSTVFVLPSFAEGIPVVLMEAMAIGVPVVSTTVAGIPELIRSGTDGMLAAPSDPAGLADVLAQLLGDVDLRRRLAASARRRVETDYSHVANVAELAGVFSARV
jgi:glycosyltransferase involved in cell wall biosynthesis